MIAKDKKYILVFLAILLTSATIYTVGYKFEWWGRNSDTKYSKPNEILYSYVTEKEKILKDQDIMIERMVADTMLFFVTIDKLDSLQYNTELEHLDVARPEKANELFLKPIKDLVISITGLDPVVQYYNAYTNDNRNDPKIIINQSYAANFSAYFSSWNNQDVGYGSSDTIRIQSNSKYSKSAFNEKKNGFKTNLELCRVAKIQELNSLKTEHDLLENTIKDFSTEMDEIKKTSNNGRLIEIAIPIFALSLVLFLIIPAIYKNGKTQRALLLKGKLPDIITVFLLTAVILILGMGNKLSSEVLGTLLGGISVYVLQRRLNEKDKKGEPNTISQLQADFIMAQSIISVGEELSIADHSTGTIKEYTWLFAGGSPGHAKGAGPQTVSYAKVGTYTIVLSVKGETGNASVTKQVQVVEKMDNEHVGAVPQD